MSPLAVFQLYHGVTKIYKRVITVFTNYHASLVVCIIFREEYI